MQLTLLVTEWRDFAKGVQEIIEGVEWDA